MTRFSVLAAAVAATLIIAPAAAQQQANTRATCPFKVGTTHGTWPKVGQMVLAIKSVDASCLTADVQYGRPGSTTATASRPIKDGKLRLPCGPDNVGTCSFEPAGAKLNAAYADSLGRTNAAVFQ